MRRSMLTATKVVAGPPSYVGVGAPSAFTGGGNIVRPAVVADDFMLCVLVSSAGALTVSGPPSGWTQIGSATTSSTYSIDVWWKIASGSEPADYAWTTGVSTNAAIVAYRNVTGIRAQAGSANGSSTTVTFASITATLNDCLLAIACKSDSNTATAPTGYVERIDETGVSGTRGVYLADDTTAAGGATGSVTCTQSAGSETATKHIALIPA